MAMKFLSASYDHPIATTQVWWISQPNHLIFPPIARSISTHRQVAKINYMVGEVGVALSFQHKAVLVYERVLGVDHPETLTSYINLAIYCHNTDQTSVALRLMYRARYLLIVRREGGREVKECA